jgi:hypothetical protein
LLERCSFSTGVVAIAEIGDKTQLLAIVLAAKFRKPAPIILGILAATLLNHGVAASLGFLVSEWLTGAGLPGRGRDRLPGHGGLGAGSGQGRRRRARTAAGAGYS